MVRRLLFGRQPQYGALGLSRLLLLLVGILLAVGPHFLRLPVWLPFIIAVILLWRLAAELRHWPMPGPGLRVVLSSAGFIAIGLSYGGLRSEAAGVGLLITMLALKLTESATARDGLVAAIFAIFAVAAQALYSQSIIQTAWMLFALGWLLAVQLAFTHEGLSLGKAAKAATALLLQSLPIALLLFVLFPRLPGPLWGIGLGGGAFTTGLSDEMRLGDVSSLAQSSEVAFRVQWPGKAPATNELYWRGPVLWDYDGSEWQKGREPGLITADVRQQLQPLLANSAPLNYEVFLEPHEKRWLFVLDMAAPLQGLSLPEGRKASLSDQMQWLSSKNVVDPLRYQASSFAGSRLPLALSPRTQSRALRLPAGFNPKTIALGREWGQQYGSSAAVVAAAQRWFIAQQFRYTLRPSPLGDNQLDDFLFRNKNGFCGHFASSFAALMRAANIPSRLVAGYQGGEVNPLADYAGDYMVVRQSQAHIWVEVWLEDQGWLRVDPTGWAAPGRLTDGLADTLPGETSVPTLFSLQGSMFGRLRLNYDLLNYRWQRMVLSYDGERQLKFLSGIHPWLGNIGNLIALCGVLLAVLAIGYSSWLLRKDGRVSYSEVEKHWQKLLRKIAKQGLHQRPQETATAFMQRASERWPSQRLTLTALAREYSALRYSKLEADFGRFEVLATKLQLDEE